MKQGRVIISMKKYTPFQPVKLCFIPFFLTYYISNFDGNNCWKSVNFVLTLVSDTDYIITYIQHATLKEYEYTSFAVHTW